MPKRIERGADGFLQQKKRRRKLGPGEDFKNFVDESLSRRSRIRAGADAAADVVIAPVDGAEKQASRLSRDGGCDAHTPHCQLGPADRQGPEKLLLDRVAVHQGLLRVFLEKRAHGVMGADGG